MIKLKKTRKNRGLKSQTWAHENGWKHKGIYMPDALSERLETASRLSEPYQSQSEIVREALKRYLK